MHYKFVIQVIGVVYLDQLSGACWNTFFQLYSTFFLLFKCFDQLSGAQSTHKLVELHIGYMTDGLNKELTILC